MRILLINQTFYPDYAATAQHAHDLARYLVSQGHEVTAIASRSIYGEKGAALAREEVVDGIRIVRVGKSIFGKSSILARSIDFGLFYLLAFWKSMVMQRQDVVICFTTPPFVALIGWFLRLVRGTRYVYWVMDLYPDVAVACGVMNARSPLTWVLERLNRFCLRHADRAVVLGRCMQARVVGKGIPASNLALINVWSDPSDGVATDRSINSYRREWNIGDRVLVMYSGNFGIGHDVVTIADSVQALRDDSNIVFAFVGGGKRKDELISMLRERGLTNYIEAPYQPRERIHDLLSAADIHLASLASGSTGIMVPSKFYGVLAVARPIVYIGEEAGEAARVINEEQCGIVVALGDAAALAAAIRKLAVDRDLATTMGNRARAVMVEKWGATHAMRKWNTLLGEVANAGRRRV